MGSAAQNSEPPASVNRANDKGAGPTPGLVFAVLAHAGLLAWSLASAPGLLGPFCLPVCGMLSSLTAFGLLVIFLIAAFGSRRALPLVVFPSLLVAGAWTYLTARADAQGSARPLVAAVLGFGALCVAVTLSFAAASIGARVSPGWKQTRLARSPAFWVGAVGLAAVVGMGAASHRVAPAAAVFAGVGILAFGTALGGVKRNGDRGAGMAELISAVLLSLGAIWAGSIVAGARTVSAGLEDWPQASTAMRFAWFSAMPLVLAAFIALVPHLSSVGVGVLGGWTFVLTTTVGVLTCVGLSKAVLARTSHMIVQATQAERANRASRAVSPGRQPVVVAPAPTAPLPSGTASHVEPEPAPEPQSEGTATQSRPSTETSTHVSGATPTSADPPGAAGSRGETPETSDANEQELELSYEGKETSLGLYITTHGPMLPQVARQGVTKSFQRLVSCYEESTHKGKRMASRVEFVVNPRGGVTTVDFTDPQGADSKYVTCVQLAFLRSGFQRSPDNTRMNIAISFAPND